MRQRCSKGREREGVGEAKCPNGYGSSLEYIEDLSKAELCEELLLFQRLSSELELELLAAEERCRALEMRSS